MVLPTFDTEARVAAKSVPSHRAHQAAEAVRAIAEMKSKSVSSSESEDSDEGADPDLEESEGEDYKHTEDEDPKRPKPVVAAAPATAALVVLPQIVPRNTAALALARVAQSRKKGGTRNNRL